MANIRNKVIKPFTNQTCVIACSGGVDSVVLLHFMLGYNNVRVIHVNHNPGNAYDDACEELVKELCLKYGVPLDLHHITENITNNFEHNWRNFRQKIYRAYDCDVYLGHTLDDQVEEYLMSSIKGNVRFIQSRRNNLCRPFLNITKSELYEYAKKYDLKWIEDPTNYDGSNQRSLCRNEIVPQALKINPGLYKTVLRLSQEKCK